MRRNLVHKTVSLLLVVLLALYMVPTMAFGATQGVKTTFAGTAANSNSAAAAPSSGDSVIAKFLDADVAPPALAPSTADDDQPAASAKSEALTASKADAVDSKAATNKVSADEDKASTTADKPPAANKAGAAGAADKSSAASQAKSDAASKSSEAATDNKSSSAAAVTATDAPVFALDEDLATKSPWLLAPVTTLADIVALAEGDDAADENAGTVFTVTVEATDRNGNNINGYPAPVEAVNGYPASLPHMSVPQSPVADEFFSYWVDEDGNRFYFKGAANPTLITRDITVRAVFANSRHTVIFYGGSGAALSAQQVADGGLVVAPDLDPSTAPVGKLFTGEWLSGSPNGSIFDLSTPVTSNLLLYPQTTAGVTVNFHDSQITGNSVINSLTQTISPNGEGSVSEPAALTAVPANVYAGAQFKGWYQRVGDSWVPFQFAEPVNLAGDAVLDIYAYWDPPYRPYYVYYQLPSDAGGVVGAERVMNDDGTPRLIKNDNDTPNDPSDDYDDAEYRDVHTYFVDLAEEALALSPEVYPDPADGVFLGWSYTDADGVIYTYLPGKSLGLITASLWLVATYATPTPRYTITYYPNYPSGHDDWESGASEPSESASIVENATTGVAGPGALDFSKQHYHFTGWATAAGGSVVYPLGSVLTMTHNYELYAVWAIDTHTVTYAPGTQGTWGVQMYPADYDDPTPPFSGDPNAPDAHKPGYVFNGWSPEFSDTVGGDVTYVAQWTERTDLSYTVNYLEQGTDEVLAAQKAVAGQTFG
ncbi:MAG: InlB B-repeat-containing protein, partial [Actinomycetia bacterium]|nr:InlB B-repeat-containing protein [Actinomycetes bacterium]